MKTLLLLPLLVLLVACGTFGTAEYSVKPIVSGDRVVCCEVLVKNGKEYTSLKAHIERRADGSYVVDLDERNVKAFEGQATTGETLGSGLRILAP